MSSEPTVSAHQKAPGGLANWLGLGFMRLLARLPLTWIRALGWLLGRAVGCCVGAWEGCADGWLEGLRDGCTEGREVGCTDGRSDG